MCDYYMRAGYGEQAPATAADCWLTTVSLFWGMCIWTFLGGIVTTLLIHLNAASSEYTAKITALNQYMAHRHLPQVAPPRVPKATALLPEYERRQNQCEHNPPSVQHCSAWQRRAAEGGWGLPCTPAACVPCSAPWLQRDRHQRQTILTITGNVL